MVRVIILFPSSPWVKNGLSGSVKLEEADLDAVFAVTKRRISALPVIYRTAKVRTESEAPACVTPILTLARCVPFRRIAEGTAVPIAAVTFFGEPSTQRLRRLHSRRDSIAGLPRAQSPPDVGR